MLAGPRQDRFESLDVLRGVAILGIFAVNILAMGQSIAMFSNPTLNIEHFDEQGRELWAIMSMFFQFKFITIFSALFGAGIMLMVGEEKPSPKFGIHYRRMFWLLVFGLIHAFFIWFGDILTPYAIAGLLVVLARRWRPRTLMIVGSVLLILTSLLMVSQFIFADAMTPEQRDAMVTKMWAPPDEEVLAQVEAYRGGFFERLPETAPNAAMFQIMQTIFLGPRNIGVMMFGMAFYKLGFFTLGWSFMRYLIAGIITLAIGLASSYFTANEFLRHDFEMWSLGPAQMSQYWGSLFHAFGYASLIMAICKIPLLGILRYPFAAAGRMALTNYLMASIIGMVLYLGPPGLGKIATVSFPEMANTVLIVWAAMLIWSPVWLAIFRFGPFEWLWRSLTYWKPQPLLR
ncbi:MAG: hypothetical protein DHS20C05_10750 [Hyphococcus sp.]|nr:MAG: hypothetical protein DHS20C05_10750 [Marinicaulis sp.]